MSVEECTLFAHVLLRLIDDTNNDSTNKGEKTGDSRKYMITTEKMTSGERDSEKKKKLFSPSLTEQLQLDNSTGNAAAAELPPSCQFCPGLSPSHRLPRRLSLCKR